LGYSNKFHKVALHACEGLSGVSVSDLEIKTHIQFYDKIKSTDIQETLIKAAAELITEEAPNYQYVAGRLINYNLRKEVYGKYEPNHLLSHYFEVATAGYYDWGIYESYSGDDWIELSAYIDHERDNLLTYAAMEQFRGKYLIRNRVTNKFYETLGSPIRRGDASHTGVIPFWKHFQSAVKSCSQGGVRGGAATLYYPLWHYEVEDLLVLKNNKGTEDNRIRHLDYGVQFNKVMYERLLSGGNITLFSPSDVPDLYEAFYKSTEDFRELYEKYERSKVRKKTIPAIDLFSAFVTERKDTGRIYLMNVDHANEHGSFTDAAPIKMSNLCCEITLPTTPLKDIHDESGEISLCTLAAINWGKIRKPADFEKPCTIAVRALDGCS